MEYEDGIDVNDDFHLYYEADISRNGIVKDAPPLSESVSLLSLPHSNALGGFMAGCPAMMPPPFLPRSPLDHSLFVRARLPLAVT